MDSESPTSESYTNVDNYFWGMDEEPETDIGWGGRNSSLTLEGLTSKIILCSIDIFLELLNQSFMARPLSKYIKAIIVATTTGETVRQGQRG